jgi:putative FmdB family regulatory protein
MPIYEYQCQSCDQVHEIIQRISEEPLTVCPACQGRLKKMVSMSAFHLKGGGWYSDGYSSCGSCTTAAADSSGNGKNGSNGGSDSNAGEAKKDAMPAPTATPAATSSDKGSCPKGGACCAAGD